MIRTLRNIVLPALTGLAILAVVGMVGSGLVVYREAAGVHPLLGAAVLVLMGVGLTLLVVYPVAQLLRLPGALVRPQHPDGADWEKFVRRYARRLAGNSLVRLGYPGFADLEAALEDKDSARMPAPVEPNAPRAKSPLETEVGKTLAHLDRRARDVVARHAAAVFTATAVSQSGRLDSVIVISAQLRMVKEVAEVYYQRPRPRELWALYANVGASAFVAGEIQDSEVLAVLGAPVTAGITGFIPVAGADPLVSLLVTSLLDGSANAFLTLRIGALARRYCGVRLEGDRRAVARSASLEAATLLSGVVGQGANRVATMTRKLVLGGAARGTSRAARGVAGFGTGLFEKIFGLAGKAGSAAVGSTTAGVRFLQESLRFWETVADGAEDAEGPGPGTPEGPRSRTAH
jgi:hypothetical protein